MPAPAPPPRRLAVLLIALLAGCGAEPPAARSVLLVTLDTTRADALGAYGGPAGVTPQLDALAAESVAYLEARTVTPLTLPAHASMLTGLYPPRHRVRDNNWRLSGDATTLAELASARGLATAAFVASAALDAGGGTDQGFATYSQPEAPELRHTPQYESLPAREVTRRAVAWLDDLPPGARFLLWVHYFDPHYPYEPPPAFVRQGLDNPYLGEVASMDHSLGVLLAELGRRGRLSDTLVLVVGDHGEALGEHGEPTHGEFCFDATLRVPFLVRHPDGRRAGERSHEPVTVADVLPTAAAALGLPVPAGLDGRSLLAPVPPERGLYFESYYGYLHYGWAPIAGWIRGRAKYVGDPDAAAFDLAADPRETRPVPPPEALRQEARAGIAALLALPRLAPDEAALDPERFAKLQAIGYATGPAVEVDLPEPLAPCDRPAAHGQADEVRAFHEAEVLGVTGRLDEAIPAFERLIEANPRHVEGLYQLGQVYKQKGRYAEAVGVLERSIALGNDSFAAHFQLAVCLRELGRRDEARSHFERAIALNPELDLAYDELAALLEESGAADEAAALRRAREDLQRP